MKKTLLTLGALTFSVSAIASDFRFSYDARDISSPESFADFHDRLQDAASRYCNAQYLKNRGLRARNDCQTDVVAIVIDEIGDQKLLAYVEQRDAQRG